MAEVESFGSGRYVVRRMLGRGGQKVVYLVHDSALDRECALSLVDADILKDDDVRRLRNEAQAIARMGAQAHIVTVYDIGEQNGRPYVVSEFVEGGDLAQELHRAAGPLSIARALDLARDLLDALEMVHARGVIHRDLKPSNVWLDAKGHAKLGDFGLALASDRSRLTMPGAVTGTPAYAAPEQLNDQPLDARADLYALGCLLYELLAGRPPFIGTVVAVISQHLHAARVPPSRHNPDVPPALDGFVMKLLAKSPAERFASATDTRAELDRIAPKTPSLPASAVLCSPNVCPPSCSSSDVEPATTAQQIAAEPTHPLPPAPSSPSGIASTALAMTMPSPPSSPVIAPVPVAAASSPAILTPVSAPLPAQAKPKRVVLGGALMLIAAIAGGTWMMMHDKPAPIRRVAVLATREATETVTGTIAWALASRVIEELDRYAEFRPVSAAGMLTARVTAIGDPYAIPDETRAPEIARRVDADTIAALAISKAINGDLTVAVHVFSTGDPAEGTSSAREKLTSTDLDGQGPARLAQRVVQSLQRQWRVARITDETGGAKGRDVPFDAYQLYAEAAQHCLVGRFEVCETLARKAIAIDSTNAVYYSQLACALSYQAGKEAEGAEAGRRAVELKDQLTSRRHKILVEQDIAWLEAEKAKQRGDEAEVARHAQQIMALNRELIEDWRDPWGYLYGAAAAQYLLNDRAKARELYAIARREAPSYYSAYFEEAELAYGDGHNAAAREEAARLLWMFIECNPRSDVVAYAYAQLKQWGLEGKPSGLSCPYSPIAQSGS
jgi:eukaryotic-like serine/threonine-protein kinase